MPHVIIGGLPMTVEVPQGDIRRGVTPGGERWHVRMPAAYGYIRGTQGADGELADVYLGPHTWQAEVLPVWVVDQVHADSREFDETKSMIGFASSQHARDTYYAGFSDGRGPDRVGAVSRLSFPMFCRWVKEGDPRKPVAFRQKSACVVSQPGLYGRAIRPIVAGGRMSSDQTGTDAGISEVKALGGVARILSHILPRMTVQERSDLVKDAGTMVAGELDKAGEGFLAGIEPVGDLWDKPTTVAPPMSGAHGPGSSAGPGVVNIGPEQHASGGGASKMEREYSDHAPQHGAFNASEALGARLQAHMGAMKAIIEAVKGQGLQITTIEAGVPDQIAKAIAALPLEELIRKAVKKAVRSAMLEAGVSGDDDDGDSVMSKAMAALHKAEDDKKDDKKEGDDDDDEEDKLAFRAKSHLADAKGCIEKAQELAASEQSAAVEAYRKAAKIHLDKAEALIWESAKGDEFDPSHELMLRQLGRLRKARRDCRPQNQDKWPNKGGVTGKSDTVADKAAEKTEEPPAEKATPPSQDLQKAVEQIEAAAQGLGLMNSNIQQVLDVVVGRQSAVIADSGVRLPPVFALAKSSAGVAAVERELADARDGAIITPDEFDKAREALSWVRMGLPQDTISAKIARLTEPAREILNRQRAA
jgi:hypothetical protein